MKQNRKSVRIRDAEPGSLILANSSSLLDSNNKNSIYLFKRDSLGVCIYGEQDVIGVVTFTGAIGEIVRINCDTIV